MAIDGSSLEKPDTETLTLIGRGFYTEVSDIKLTPGQRDFVVSAYADMTVQDADALAA